MPKNIEAYLLKRWMKSARNRVSNDATESDSGDRHVSDMVFANQAMRSFYDLIQLGKGCDEGRNVLSGLLDSVSEQLSTIVQNMSVDDEMPCEDTDQIDEVCIRNPLTAKARGLTNAHITRHWDEKSKKGKGKGKGKAENSRGSKRKVQGSQEATNSQESNYVPPPQTYPYFPHQFQHPNWQYPNQVGRGGNIYLSGQGGQVNLFGYPLH